MALLVVLFLVVPLLELWLIIEVGSRIGAFETIAVLILISVLGAWLAHREGLGVWRRVRASLDAGRVPAVEVVEGFLVLLAAALLLTPGFLTDLLALVLLVPVTRAGVRRVVGRRLSRRVGVRVLATAPPRPPRPTDVVDV